MVEAEEYRKIRPVRLWTMVIALSVLLVIWGLINYWLIPDPVRTWNYGVAPDAPSESPYSTELPPPEPVVPVQLPHLPEAPTRPDEQQEKGS
jgi:hypothetical protein